MVKGLECLFYENRLGEKSLVRPYSSFPIPKRCLQESWGGTLCLGV